MKIKCLYSNAPSFPQALAVPVHPAVYSSEFPPSVLCNALLVHAHVSDEAPETSTVNLIDLNLNLNINSNLVISLTLLKMSVSV